MGPLSVIINWSLYKGIFPDQLKIAKTIFDNYRPISLLPVISKVFEKIVAAQITNYFTNNKLFFQSQHGFRSKHSTKTAAIEFIDFLKIEIDKRHIPISILMDLSKAFEHGILLKKIEFYGLDIVSIRWFESYLLDRKQFVVINSENFSLKTILTGVPQGSILDPLLFLIYINDIQFCSDKLTFSCFADDTTGSLFICPKNVKCEYCGRSSVSISSYFIYQDRICNVAVFGRSSVSVSSYFIYRDRICNAAVCLWKEQC